MIPLLQGIAAIIALFLMLLPAILIIAAAVQYGGSIGGGSRWLIVIGALILLVVSFDVFSPLVMTLVFDMDAEELANAAIVLAYAKPALSWLALLMIGGGMLWNAKRIRARSTGASQSESGKLRSGSSDEAQTSQGSARDD